MKKKIKNILLRSCALLLCFMMMAGMTASADTPYKTYTVDGYGYVLETQSAYNPLAAITKVGETSFVTPVDMAISKEGNLYIADAGAHVILVSNLEGEQVGIIGEGILQTPTGVYVAEDGTVYVADKDAKKVFVFDKAGNLTAEYGKPNSPIYGNEMDFKPTKVVANKTGTMYVICEGNMNGIVQLSPVEGGSFLGYFGTNYTSLSPFQMLQRIILTDAQRAQMLSNIPSTPTNLHIDETGLIYTVTQGDQDMSLKKLNIAGRNLLDSDPYWADLPAAVTTGNYKNILVADSDGYIYEYNEEGELLFMFGGRDDGRQRIGLCNKVEAIAVDDADRIYLLDSDKKQIHVFEPTEFTNLLHESLYLFSKGQYTASKEPLSKVLQMNSMFDYANQAMGHAYLQEENYEEALRYFRLAKSFDGYSDAFWEVRNIWIRSYMGYAILGIILLVLAWKGAKYLWVKKYGETEKVDLVHRTDLAAQLRYSLYFMRHPMDGCYGVKREGKASWACANILLTAFILISIIEKYFSGFLVKNVREGRYDILTDIGSVLIVFIGLTLCNYLVVTINEGEGFLKELYCAYAYCLTPFIVIKPFVVIISNVLTFNEVFLITFANIIVWVWVLILLLLALKEINNFNVKETAKALGITAFTVLILSLLVCVIYVLFSQVIDFVVTVVREVVYRIGN
ncbi:MAG: YIP1 family protein [Lachnospiraceae bacterium]|nr:YIP1 family protein [Lachnospiraceae bacterium]